MIEPIDLAPELQRASELKDVEIMRALDARLGVIRYEVTDALQTINDRLEQYIRQMPFSFEFLMAQTLQDFKRWVTLVQVKSLSVPVALLKTGQPIYAVRHTRPDFVSYSDTVWSLAMSEWNRLSEEERATLGPQGMYKIEADCKLRMSPPKCFTIEKPKE